MSEAHRDVERFYEGVSANWATAEVPTKAMMCRWFLGVFPIKRPELWAMLRDSLAMLDMPIDGLVHTCPPLEE
jgi:hypothetical protein